MKKTVFLFLGFILAAHMQAAIEIPSASIPADTVQSDVDRLGEVEEKLSILGQKMSPWGALKLSGYIQLDVDYFQKSDEVLFNVRRGRLKTAYSNEWGAAVFQLNINEKGVNIVDAYLKAQIPNFEYLTLQAGIYDRPFGYEIGYSSSKRESPERSRIITTLFPSEKDLGASLIFKGKKGTAWNNLSLTTAIMAGNGVALEEKSIYGDTDKDFVARLHYKQKLDKLSYGVGTSYYFGNVYSGSYVDSLGNDVAYTNYKMEGKDYVEANTTRFQRQYFGVEAQFSVESVLGRSKFSAEFLTGTQPGLSGSSVSHSSKGYLGGKAEFEGSTDSNAGDIYLRNFMGGYFTFVQEFGKKRQHSLVLKYDQYDPNSKVSGIECKNEGDVMHQTFGFGYIYQPAKFVRIMAYMDLVWNEVTALSSYNGDLKDNVITLRTQFKF